MPIPNPSATPEGAVVVNVTGTVPPDVKVNSLLAPPPGLMALENELTSTGVWDGDAMSRSESISRRGVRQMSQSPDVRHLSMVHAEDLARFACALTQDA